MTDKAEMADHRLVEGRLDKPLIRKQGKRWGGARKGKGSSMIEQLELVVGIRQLVDESEDKEALIKSLVDEGISQEYIDFALNLSEDEVKSAEDEIQKDKEEEHATIIALMEARKIASGAAEAFLQRKKHNGADGRTKVEVDEQGAAHYSYRGNRIATHHPDGKITATMAGWPTTTTRSHLNHISQAVHGRSMFGQKKGGQYYGDQEIGAKDVITMKENYDPEESVPQLTPSQQIMAAILNDQPATAKEIIGQVMVDGLNTYVDNIKDSLLRDEDEYEEEQPEEEEPTEDENLEEWGNQPLADALGKGGLTGVLKKPKGVGKPLNTQKTSVNNGLSSSGSGARKADSSRG